MIWCLSNNKLQQTSESRETGTGSTCSHCWPEDLASRETVAQPPHVHLTHLPSFIYNVCYCLWSTNKQNPCGVIAALTNGHGELSLGRLCVTMSWLGVLFFCLLIGCLCWNDLCVLMFHWLLVLPCFKLNCQNKLLCSLWWYCISVSGESSAQTRTKVFSLTWAEGRRTWAKFDKYSLPVSRVCQLFLRHYLDDVYQWKPPKIWTFF